MKEIIFESIFNVIYKKNFTLTKEVLILLKKKSTLIKFPARKYLLKQGEFSKNVYVILQGIVEVIKKDQEGSQKTIATLENGSIVGEMGIFLKLRHTASVIAKTEVETLEFYNADFMETALNIPYLGIRLYNSLITRLDQSNQKYILLLKQKNDLKVASYLLGMENRTYLESFFSLDLKKISVQLNIDIEELKTIFKNFVHRRLISDYELDLNNIAHFKLKVKNLLSYIKNI
jgi:CRP-like cAMP-binding protein